MVSKTITISGDAYEFLRRLKRKDTSFSDVILLMKNKHQDVMSYAGILKKADLKSIKKIRDEMRADWAKR